MPSAALAKLCYTLAASGIDVVKDDHGLADQAYSPFAERVAACQRAIERARRETGAQCIYAPSLVGSPRALAAQARIARDEGAGAVLLAPALIGMPAFAEFVAVDCDVPVLAHPAYGGAARVAPPLLLGRLFRWLGADAVIFPNFGGRFAYTRDECAGIAANSRCDWGGYRRTLPVPAGGLSVERVDEIVRFYGSDVMLLIGGSLLAAGDRLPERARAFVAATRDAAAHAGAAPRAGCRDSAFARSTGCPLTSIDRSPEPCAGATSTCTSTSAPARRRSATSRARCSSTIRRCAASFAISRSARAVTRRSSGTCTRTQW